LCLNNNPRLTTDENSIVNPASQPLPDLHTLIGLFYEQPEQLGRFTQVSAEQMPPAERRLLAHEEHMTVTVEAFHGCPVRVAVLERQSGESHYSRKILLHRTSDEAVVQFGIVRLDLNAISPDVRREIENETTPLGRVLIEHNVLRHVELATLWKIEPGPDLCAALQLERSRTVFGRTALIYCDGEPAVELLEIVTLAGRDN